MASQVMTVSRICVLLGFTIFFETVRTTTPSTFTDADTSPLATESVTTASTFTDADTSPYATDNTTENVTMATDLAATISNNTTENVTMATDLTATTIANNTTENVTIATDLPATTIANNTTENVTMATDLPATTISDNTTENMTMATDLPATTITNNTTQNVTMPTVIPPTTNPNIELNTLFSITMAGLVFSNGLLAVFATQLKRLCSRKSPEFPDEERASLINTSYGHEVESSNYPEQQIKDANYKPHKGRVSYYELWKLVQYAYEEEETDQLDDAVKQLMKEAGLNRSTYGSTDKSDKNLYQLLCDWKKRCDNPRMNQLGLLFKKCIAAKMMKSMGKLRNLRRIVWDVPDSTSNDLEHILWQIGKKSKQNITKLLEKLKVENTAIGDRSNDELKKIVDKASSQLQEWKQGLVPINPIVMISLALEDLKLSEVVEETAAKSDISVCSRTEED